MRFFIDLAYNGKAYHGWQKQPTEVSVQEKLEEALHVAFQKEVKVFAAGRTDTGVHARQLFVHFVLDLKPNFLQLKFKLNTLLPKDIAIKDIFEVQPDAHARFDALSREYQYFVSTEKDPFQKEFSYYVKNAIDLRQMNEAAAVLMEYDDFKCFSKVKTDVNTYFCKIEKAHWEKIGDQLVFTIKADRFLRNMVRAIVGTLLNVGTGKITVADVHQIVQSRDRGEAGKSVAAKGLFLTKIEYPQSINVKN